MAQAISAVEAFSVAASPRHSWTFAIVRDAAGTLGMGETDAEGRTDLVEREIRTSASALVGRAAEPGTLDACLHQAGVSIGNRSRAALSQALWDLDTRAAAVPLVARFGLRRRDLIKCYANLNRGLGERAPAVFAEHATAAVLAGFEALKIAPFDGLSPALCGSPDGQRLIEAGLERIAAVRTAAGPGVGLFVDCHWRFDEPRAAAVIRHVAEMGVTWFECPLPESEDMLAALRRLRRLARSCGVRLAGGDEFHSPMRLQTFLAADVYDVFMPDVKYLGVEATVEIAQKIVAAGADCSFHNPCGPIAHAHNVHLSALLATTTPLEFPFASTPLFMELVGEGAPFPARGGVCVPAQAGIGAAIRDQFLPRKLARRES